MKNYFKIVKILPGESKSETGNISLQEIAPFGPPFKIKNEAKQWLKDKAAENNEYLILRFYSLSVPDNLQANKKKDKK